MVDNHMWPSHCSYTEEDGHAHVSAYVYIETITKLPVKIKQVLFESVPQVQYIQPISPIHPHYLTQVNRS